MTWAFGQDVEPPAKLVLLALANRTNHETGMCFPGQELIAEECSMSVRTVRRHLKTLEDCGLLERRMRMSREGRGRTSDSYRLLIDQPDKSAGESRPTGQIETTNRTNQVDQPDTVVRGTVSEPKGNPKVARRTSMTESWQPDPDNVKRLKEKYPKVDVDREVDAFRDHFISKGEPRADWNAGLRTWIRNADKWDKTKAHTPPSQFPAGSGGIYL